MKLIDLTIPATRDALDRLLNRADVSTVTIHRHGAMVELVVVRDLRPSIFPGPTLFRCLSQAEGAMDPKPAPEPKEIP